MFVPCGYVYYPCSVLDGARRMKAGSKKYTYEVVEGWPRLPSGWSFHDVAGLAVDSKDRIYVFHRGARPVMTFDREGNLLDSWGDGVFDRAHSIRVGTDDMVYCVDYGDHTVRKLTPDGELLFTLGNPGHPSDTGGMGYDYRTIRHAAGPFNRPTDVAFGPSGDLYISDGYCNARIHRFSKDGTLLNSWGEPGDGPSQLHLPHGIMIDEKRKLFVADRENSRVQILSLEGDFIGEWSDCNRPACIFMNKEQEVFVAEMGYIRENMFPNSTAPPDRKVCARMTIRSLEGRILQEWGAERKEDMCAAGNFWAPHALCMDSRGDIYVGEVTIAAKAPPNCHPLQKFRKVS